MKRNHESIMTIVTLASKVGLSTFTAKKQRKAERSKRRQDHNGNEKKKLSYLQNLKLSNRVVGILISLQGSGSQVLVPFLYKLSCLH